MNVITEVTGVIDLFYLYFIVMTKKKGDFFGTEKRVDFTNTHEVCVKIKQSFKFEKNKIK